MQLAYLKCIDPQGVPKQGEAACLYDGKPYRFKPGEEVFMDYNIAQWFASRPRYKDRFKILEQHPTIQAIIRGGKIIPVGEDGRPLDVQVLTPTEKKKQTKMVEGFGEVEVGPAPNEVLSKHNEALAKGRKGDVTVG